MTTATERRRIGRELLLAGIVGAVFGASPLTGDDLGPKLLAGAGVAAAVYAWRARHAAGDEGAAAGAPSAARPGLAVWGVLALYAALVGPTVAWLFGRWTMSVWVNDHGIFIPFIAAYLAWTALRDDSDTTPDSSAWGFVWLAAGAGLILLDSGVRTGYLAAVGLLVTIPGMSLLLLGARRTRAIRLALVTLPLMMPIPNSVATDLYLRTITTSLVTSVVQLLGIPTLRQGTVIITASDTFIVSNACSGFATLYASLAVALILSFITRSPWRRVALLLLAPPLAIAANVARVTSLVLMTRYFGQWVIASPLHPGSGVVAFAIVLGVLFWVGGNRGPATREATA